MAGPRPWLAILLLVVGGGCGRGPDPAAVAAERLRASGLPEVQADWDDDARVLRLHDAVPDEVERRLAERVAAGALGAGARVVNDVEVAEDHLQGDARLEVDIERLFGSDAALGNREVDVEVADGVVRLRGTVSTDRECQRAYNLASTVPGVKQVVNQLRVGG